MKRIVVAGLVTYALLVVGYSAQAGVGPDLKCKDAKGKAAALKGLALMKAFGKNMKTLNDDKLAQDISKAQSKFTKGFTKAESKGGCLTSGDAEAIEVKVDAFIRDVIEEISGITTSTTTTTTTTTTIGTTTTTLRFVDNADGTITDNQTGLMWEKKDEAGGIHDKDNGYTWAGCCDGNCTYPYQFCQPNAAAAAACTAQTGGAAGCLECSVGTCDIDPWGWGAITTIWDWLVQVNTEGFAGHSDWRIPSEEGCNSCREDWQCPCDPAELESILLAPYPCGTSPCIDPIFRPTASGHYWTGSTNSGDPILAWYIDFFTGFVGLSAKYNDEHVRAVRGGL